MGLTSLFAKSAGGILGAKPKTPNVLIRDTSEDDARSKQSGDIDPNRSDAVAEARMRRRALGRRTGRSALRIDLSQGSGQTRSGISIG